jgi:hypothetical protein
MTALCLEDVIEASKHTKYDFSSLVVGQVLAADLVWRGCAKSPV